jgi:hypothetical protein
MTRQTRSSLRDRSGHGATGAARRRLGQLARRFFVTASAASNWALEGWSDSLGTETDEVENFPGVGFESRPSVGANAEVVTVDIGADSDHPVIVATRDHEALKILTDGEGIEAGETVIYTRSSMVKICADGKIEIGSIGGTRQALATIADLESLKAIFAAWVVSATDGGLALKTLLTAASPAGWHPTGTTKVEAE